MKKVCKVCLIEKTLDDFYRCHSMTSGRLNVCKACKIKYVKKYTKLKQKSVYKTRRDNGD